MKRRFNDIDAIENENYKVLLKNEQNLKGGRPSTDHLIKLDTTKEMAMPHIITKEGIYLWTAL
ncbi:MAG: antA/AntB antirepressor family protein [Lachnospiraceae bacterium]